MKWNFCFVFLHYVESLHYSASISETDVNTLKGEISTKLVSSIKNLTKNQVDISITFKDITSLIPKSAFCMTDYNAQSISHLGFEGAIKGFNWQSYDSVFVIWPAKDKTEEFNYGFAFSQSLSDFGSTYAVLPCNVSSVTKFDCQFVLHEWLHGACSFFKTKGCSMPVGVVNENGKNVVKEDADCGGFCGYDTNPPQPAPDNWINYYRDLASCNVKVPPSMALCGIPVNYWGLYKPRLVNSSKIKEVYAVDYSGNLYWYGYGDQWINSQGKLIGNGWGSNDFKFLFNGGNGIIYGVKNNGELLWYKHKGVYDGTAAWESSAGKLIGTGWQDFKKVFSLGNGIIYGILYSGELRWYKHEGYNDGSNRWASAQGITVGSGWQNFISVFGISNNIIYGVLPNGSLIWYKHDGSGNGTPAWGGQSSVGVGWQDLNNIFGRGEGEIFGILGDGSLKRYIHEGYVAGTNLWQGVQGTIIGSGWQSFQFVF